MAKTAKPRKTASKKSSKTKAKAKKSKAPKKAKPRKATARKKSTARVKKAAKKPARKTAKKSARKPAKKKAARSTRKPTKAKAPKRKAAKAKSRPKAKPKAKAKAKAKSAKPKARKPAVKKTAAKPKAAKPKVAKAKPAPKPAPKPMVIPPPKPLPPAPPRPVVAAPSAPQAAPPPAPKPRELKVGDMAPELRLPADNDQMISLSDFRGKKVVLYFYPKDDTTGCTLEACSFRDSLESIRARGAVVLGVSIDPVLSHQRFRDKFTLNFPLLSDRDKQAVEAYGVWKERSMYGQTFMGTERTTFIIDENGRITKIFPKVKVEGHIEEVLNAL